MPKNRKKKIVKKKTKKGVKFLRKKRKTLADEIQESDGFIFDSSRGKTDSLFVNNSSGTAIFACEPVKKELDELIKEFDEIQQKAENAEKAKAEARNYSENPKIPQPPQPVEPDNKTENKNVSWLKKFFNLNNRFL